MARQTESREAFTIHPGEVLREEFMKPLGLSSNMLAKALHVSTPRINDIVLERRAVTADTALRLSRYFGGSPQMWLNLQMEYDLCAAKKSIDLKSIAPRKSQSAA